MENGTYHYKIEAAVPLGIRRGSMAVELHNGGPQRSHQSAGAVQSLCGWTL